MLKREIDLPRGELVSGIIDEKPNLGSVQEKNFKKLKETLEPLNIELHKFWFGIFQLNNGKNATNFLFESKCRNILWRKYEGLQPGGGQNLLYVKNHKIQLTKWFDMNINERMLLLQQ